MQNKKTICVLAAFEDVGSGRSLEAYYQQLTKSSLLTPVMAYTNPISFAQASSSVTNKILFPIPPVKKSRSNLLLDTTYRPWLDSCKNYIRFIKAFLGDHLIWILDNVWPELEDKMDYKVIQVFHGELFDVGCSYFNPPKSQSFKHYGLILVYGQLMKDRIMQRCQLNNDNRIKIIGRVLNDSLYKGVYSKNAILNDYGLSSSQKTLLYAPTWESKKIWSIGKKKDDPKILKNFCDFCQIHNLNLIIRPHPISLQHYQIKNTYKKITVGYNNVYFDDSTNHILDGPNKSLVAADILITDLSSIALDFMSLNKPAIFLYPKAENAKTLWGDNLPSLEKVATISHVVKNFNELYSLIQQLLKYREKTELIEKRRKIVAYGLTYTDGKSGLRFKKEVESYVKSLKPPSFNPWKLISSGLQKSQKIVNKHQTHTPICLQLSPEFINRYFLTE